MKEIIVKTLISWTLLILSVFLALALNAALGLWLWGLIIIPIFNAPVLTFWQMFGLCLLARLMTTGIFTVSFGKKDENIFRKNY